MTSLTLAMLWLHFKALMSALLHGVSLGKVSSPNIWILFTMTSLILATRWKQPKPKQQFCYMVLGEVRLGLLVRFKIPSLR